MEESPKRLSTTEIASPPSSNWHDYNFSDQEGGAMADGFSLGSVLRSVLQA